MKILFNTKGIIGRRLRNMSITTWLLTIGILVLAVLASCKNEETGPDTKPSKEYSWTIDTLAYPGSLQTTMQDMWGSSHTNVYIVGHNATERGQMYHYDGYSWMPVKYSQAEGGPIRVPNELNAIDGTSPDDIWCVGYRWYIDSVSSRLIDSSFIMHYNGYSWDESIVHGGRQLLNVWAGSRDNVWAAGAEGTVFHFDGTTWTKHNLGRKYFHANIYGIYTSKSDYKVYTIGYRDDYAPPNDSAGYFLFEYSNNQWKIIDSVSKTPGSPSPHFGYGMWSDKHRLYTIGEGIFVLTDQGWNTIATVQAGHMYESSADNIFAVGLHVYRYDGIKWKEYPQFYTGFSFVWFDCYTDSSEVFVLGNDNYKTFVLHGK